MTNTPLPFRSDTSASIHDPGDALVRLSTSSNTICPIVVELGPIARGVTIHLSREAAENLQQSLALMLDKLTEAQA